MNSIQRVLTHVTLAAVALTLIGSATLARAERIKDLASVQGVRSNAL